MKQIKVVIIKQLDEAFIGKWSTLLNYSKNTHFFNTPQWFSSCLNAYDIKEYFIFAAYQGSGLVGVLPLIKSKKFFVDVFASPGEKYLEKSSVLAKNENPRIINEIISQVLKNGNIYLAETPEKITAILAKRKSRGILTLSSINPYIQIEDFPFGTISEKHKKRIAGIIKKNSANLKFGHYRNNLSEHLQSVFELESRSSKKQDHKDCFSNPDNRRLFKSLIKHAGKDIVINFVYFKNLPIVSSFGFIFNNTYLAYHTSYDKDFSYLIPGKILTYNMLIKLREEGVDLFDFSRGHNEFKNDFTKMFAFQYDYYYSTDSLIRIWWEVINFARRLKANIFKNNRSLDGYCLFKKYPLRSIASQENVRLTTRVI